MTAKERNLFSTTRHSGRTQCIWGHKLQADRLRGKPQIAPFGSSQSAKDPDFDRTARETRSQPAVFAGDKTKFETWLFSIIEHLDPNRECYRDERARITLIFNRVAETSREMLRHRYMSDDNPFVSAQEMVAQSEAIFGDPDASITTSQTLSSLRSKTISWLLTKGLSPDMYMYFNISCAVSVTWFDQRDPGLLIELPEGVVTIALRLSLRPRRNTTASRRSMASIFRLLKDKSLSTSSWSAMRFPASCGTWKTSSPRRRLPDCHRRDPDSTWFLSSIDRSQGNRHAIIRLVLTCSLRRTP